MKVKLMKGVYWDTESTTQSDDAVNFIRDNILNKLASTRFDSSDLIQPEYDQSGRPIRWVVELDYCVVSVENKYQRNGSWALDSQVISIKSR